jgi:hypothetical protein
MDGDVVRFVSNREVLHFLVSWRGDYRGQDIHHSDFEYLQGDCAGIRQSTGSAL